LGFNLRNEGLKLSAQHRPRALRPRPQSARTEHLRPAAFCEYAALWIFSQDVVSPPL
jgi:hypothetical protein